MAMSAAVLATQFANVLPEADEADAIANFADAYAVYAAFATAASPILPAGVALGKAAMVLAMAGLSGSGAGAGKLKDGVVAFWGAVALGLATSFAGATAILRPTFPALDLQPDFDDITDNSKTQAQAALILATTLHTEKTNGTVTTAGPTVTPII